MAKKRVYELAKELGMQNKELVDWLHAHGYEDIKSHSSSIDDDQAAAVTDRVHRERNPMPVAAAPSQGFVVRRRRVDVEAAHPERMQPPPMENGDGAAGPAGVMTRRGQYAEEERAETAPEEGAEERGAEEEREGPTDAESPAQAPAVAASATEQPAAVAAHAHPAHPPHGTQTQYRAVPTPRMPGVQGPNVPAYSGQDHSKLRPTATQAVVISRPLIPVRRVTPPSGQFKSAPMAPGQRAIGAVREFKVVPDSLGRGREFIDVTKDKAGRTRRGTGARPGGEPKKELSKQELIDIATGRAHIPVSRARKKRPTKKGAKTQITTPSEHKKVIRIEEAISLSDLSQRMGIKANDLIRKLMKLGTTATINQLLDVETAQLLATDHGYTVEKAGYEESEFIAESEDRPEDLQPRPPVVTIMGHVDHGKTSLLDAIRSANVAEGEAGGITQHIGAYTVNTPKGPVTFLDTPGHEAFTAMRARGAQATDVAVLVVAADDGVMPQTVESINHAKAAEVPIIVAINKVDKPGVNPDRVKQMLSDHALVPEEWGGDTIMVPVSAKTRLGLEQLLEYIALQSEVLELQANPSKPATGLIIEGKLEKGRGPVATVLVQDGTLRPGDAVVSGKHYGKVRQLMDDKGRIAKELKPGYSAEITGLSGTPTAGDPFNVVKDLRSAEEVAKNRELLERKKDMAKTSKVSLEELFSRAKKADVKELKIVLRADVQGSVEACANALEKLTTSKVKVHILQKLVGAITESDVNLAKASGAIVVGFNVKPESKVTEVAARYDVDIKQYSIIYEMVDDVRLAMEGLLDVILREKAVGKAEVRNTFNVPKIGTIAGCAVTEGKVVRSGQVRVFRGGKAIHTGKISSLRRFKDDVKEVASGFECGIGVEGFNDIQVADILEVYEIERIRQSL